MKKLFELINELSKETDNIKRAELHYKINLLRSQLNSEKLVNDIQKIYNTK